MLKLSKLAILLLAREIKKYRKNKNYRYKQVDILSKQRYKNKKHYKLTIKMKEEIIELLRSKYNPEQISGRWKLQNKYDISHRTIYRYLCRNYK